MEAKGACNLPWILTIVKQMGPGKSMSQSLQFLHHLSDVRAVRRFWKTHHRTSNSANGTSNSANGTSNSANGTSNSASWISTMILPSAAKLTWSAVGEAMHS